MNLEQLQQNSINLQNMLIKGNSAAQKQLTKLKRDLNLVFFTIFGLLISTLAFQLYMIFLSK